MKSATTIQLDKAWWKKEQPPGLKKAGPAFEKALDQYDKALKALEKSDRGPDVFEDALKQLEKAAKEVVGECRDLDKKTGNKKLKDELKNTIAVMERPLASAIAAEREQASRVSAGKDDDDDEGVLGDPKKYSAYLKTMAKRLKNGQMSFAFGLASNEPEGMRLVLHRTAKPRALVGRLKKEFGAKKATFGIAGSAGLAESEGEEATAQTLVLDVQGKMISGLARRVRKMLKAMKVEVFTKVRILQGGKDVPEDDENAPDTLDLDERDDDEAEAEEAGAENPDAAKFRDARDRLLPRIAAVTGSAPPDEARRLGEAWTKILALADRDPAGALAAIPAFIKMLTALSGAQGGGEPAALKELADRLRLAIGAVKEAIAARPALKGQLQQALAAAKTALDGGDGARCGKLLDAVDKLVASGGGATARDPGRLAAELRDVWDAARSVSDRQLDSLLGAIRSAGLPSSQQVDDLGLSAWSGTANVAMMRALIGIQNASAEKLPDAARAAEAAFRGYRTFLQTHPAVGALERNPFKIPVDLSGSLGGALSRMESMLADV